jgi:hypothetical protein
VEVYRVHQIIWPVAVNITLAIEQPDFAYFSAASIASTKQSAVATLHSIPSRIVYFSLLFVIFLFPVCVVVSFPSALIISSHGLLSIQQ